VAPAALEELVRVVIGFEKAAVAAALPAFAAVAVARSVSAAHRAQIPQASPTCKTKTLIISLLYILLRTGTNVVCFLSNVNNSNKIKHEREVLIIVLDLPCFLL
jgi:hypothetical protein